MNLPKITVVTPSYNQARYVVWTARSVFLQRYPNLEYILMDGGSTDDTMARLEPYRPLFAHCVSEKDKGQSDAVAKGFACSSGEIMAYLNSDDMLSPGTLHWVANFFQQHPGVDVVYSHRVTVDEVNRVRWYWLLPPHWQWYMMRWDLIPQETCFWRRRIYEKAGNVDSTFRFALDYDLFSRFMAGGGKFKRVKRFLGVFREHGQAKTSTQLATIGQEETRRIWDHHQIKGHWFDPLVSARVYYAAMRNGGRFAHRRKKLPGALPGVGYDYNDLWGGLLNDERLPSA